MADLQNCIQIHDRHNDLKILHTKKTILEVNSIIRGLELRKDHIMQVDIAQIDFDIQCHKKRIEELQEHMQDKQGDQKLIV